MTRPVYEHTQAGWPMRLTFAALALGLIVLLAGAALAIAVDWCFSSLTIRVTSDELQLQLHFGWGWPRKRVPLADIAAVEVTRTTFIEGWGVHRTRRGWLYNVAGFDAVVLRRRDGTAVLVGSDEAPRLKGAIERARGRV